MDKQPLIASLAVMLLILIGAGTILGLGMRPHLGLDLQGGVSAIYTPELPEGQEEPEDFEDIIDVTIEIIRARVDSLGVAEPDITRQGTDVVVQLPGVADAERLRELIGTTAQLRFRPVEDIITPADPRYRLEVDDEAFDATRDALTMSPASQVAAELQEIGDFELFDLNPDCEAAVDERPEIPDDMAGIFCASPDDLVLDPDTGEEHRLKYVLGPVALTGDRVDDAFPQLLGAENYAVGLDLDGRGGGEFAAISSELACERDRGRVGQLAIVLDEVVESATNMAAEVACGVGIRGGTAQITMGGEDQQEQAQDLALILRTGALPISLEEPETFETVSPTLGAESLRIGIMAGLIGLVLVGVWLIGFYRWLGVVALTSLSVFGLLTFAIISALGELAGFALTLAGVAGLIVAIGITADSSIIYFERIRDEVNLGKTVRTAVKRAFASAFRTNLAGNTVTLAAAVILYFLAVGPVRGFALMLGMATVLDLVILYLFTRPVVGLMGRTRLMTRRSVRASEASSTSTPTPVGGA